MTSPSRPGIDEDVARESRWSSVASTREGATASPSATESVDVLVVGGGPAGALTALHAARAGLRTLLVDARADDRGVCCGHCLGRRALPILADAGVLEEVRAIAVGRVRRLRVRIAGRAAAARELAPVELDRLASRTGAGGSDALANGLLVPRSRFDAVLRDAARRAGAEVRIGSRAAIDMIERDGATVRVRSAGSGTHVVRAAIVVGADGAGSAVARRAGLAGNAVESTRIGFSWTTPIRDAQVERRGEREPGLQPGDVAMIVCEGGYLGLVRESDGRVHAAAIVDRDGPLPLDAVGLAEAFGAIDPLARVAHPERIDAADGGVPVHARAALPWRVRAVAAGPVVLVGDAAGYVEPFTGEGMTWAIEGAALLGEAIVDENARPESVASAWARAWSIRIAPSHRRCRAITTILRSRAGRALLARSSHLGARLTRPIAARVLASTLASNECPTRRSNVVDAEVAT